tara:strand:- start:7213 stop:18768 length:11556 start_codon:yes stop_codon:yes gene_type:complete
MSEQLDPITGLPVKTKGPIDPVTGMPMESSRKDDSFYSNPMSGFTTYTGNIDEYTSRGVQLNPYADIDEVRARNQSKWDQAANGVLKGVATFGTAALENTVGYGLGMTDFILSGFEDFDESMTNNPVGKYITDPVNEYMQEEFPNYYTKKEEMEQGTLKGVFNVNFLADKFLNGAAYSLASVASLYATGGSGLFAKGLLGAGKMSNSMAALKAARAVKSGKPIREAMEAGARLNKAKNATGFLESGMMMSMAESGVEAREVGSRVRESLEQEYMLENGLESPNMIPAADRNRINQFAEEQETLAFYGNMAVLMPTNVIMFGRALKPFEAGSDAINPIIKGSGQKAGQKAYIEAIDNLPGFAQKGIRLGQKVSPFVKGAATEAFQEGSQYTLSEALNDFAVAKYQEDDGSADLADSFLSLQFFKSAADAAPVVGNQVFDTLKDPEGREQMLIGGLVGLLSGGLAGGGRAREKAKRANTEGVLDRFNLDDEGFIGLSERANENKHRVKLMRVMQRAAKENNKELYEDARHMLLASDAIYHVEHGTVDMYVDRLEELKAMPAEEFSKIISSPTEVSKEEQTKILDEAIETAKQIEQNYNAIYDRFPGTPAKQGIARRFMSDESKAEEAATRADEDLMRRALLSYSAVQKNRTERMNKHLDKVSELDPLFDRSSVNVFEAVRPTGRKEDEAQTEEDNPTTPNRDAFETEKKASIERISQNDGIAGEIAAREFDLIEAMMDERDQAYRAYQELMTNPTERKGFLDRQKAAAEKARREQLYKRADEAIQNTSTQQELKQKLEELKAAGVFIDENDPKLKEVNKEIRRRRKEEEDALEKFSRMRTSALRAIDRSNLTPAEQVALDKELLELREEGQEAPRNTAPETTTSKVTEEQAGAQQESAGQSTTGSAVEELNKARNARRGQNQDNSLQTKYNGQGELMQDKEGGRDVHYVSPSGDVLVNPEYHTVGEKGTPLIDGRELLSTPDLVGRDVTLRAVETNWWLSEGQNMDPANPHINIPIAVELDGKVIGVLGSGNTDMRRAVVENPEGTVTTKVTKRDMNNLITTNVMESGVPQGPFFHNPKDLGKTYLAVVRVDTQGSLYYDLNMPEDLEGAGIPIEEREALNQGLNANNAYLAKNEQFVPGQVVLFRKDANGKLRVIAGSTSNLSEAAVNSAIELMRKGDQDNLRSIVGLNAQYDIEAIQHDKNTPTKRLLAESAGDLTLYTFDLVDENGNKMLDKGQMVQVSHELLDRVLSGDPVAWEDLDPIIHQKMIVRPTATVEGGIKTAGRPDTDTNARERGKEVYENLETYLRNLLNNKKFHIDSELINAEEFNREAEPFIDKRTGAAYDSYKDYLFNPGLGAPTNGFSGIYRTRAKLRHNTPYTDIGLTFSTAYSVNGEQVEQADQQKAKAEQPKQPSQPVGQKKGPAPKAAKGKKKTRSKIKSGNISQEEFERLKAEATQATEPKPFTGGSTSDMASAAKFVYESSVASGMSEAEALQAARRVDRNFAPRLSNLKGRKTLNKKQAEAWLNKRGIPVEWYETAQKIGNANLHGYYQNAAVYLWTNAEVGTEYHEAFHYVFRTNMEDKQRQALYKEMRAKIKKDPIDAEAFDAKKDQLKGAFPDRSAKEIEELALEEMMADTFSTYVGTQEETAKTLPAKIRKFFKDLYAIIKSMFNNPLSMRELFSVIESGYKTFPSSRPTSFMQDMAPRMVQEYADEPELHQDIVNVTVTEFETQYSKLVDAGLKGKEMQDAIKVLMGNSPTNRGLVAESMLLRGFSTGNREAIDSNSEEFTKLKNAFHDNTSASGRVDVDGLNEAIDALREEGIVPIAPLGINSVIDALDLEDAIEVSANMQNTYMHWLDEIADAETGNVASHGWRTAMMDELQLYGYNFGDTREVDNAMAEDEQDQFDKIFDLGSFEQLPDQRLSPRARAIIHSIPNPEPNSLGMYVNYNGYELYRQAIKSVAGANTLSEMRTRLRQKANVIPALAELAEYLDNENTPGWKKAILYKALRVDYTSNKTIVQSFDQDSKSGVKITRKSIKIVNSDNSSAARDAIQRWKSDAFQGERVDKPSAVYVMSKEEGLISKDASPERLGRVQRAYQRLNEGPSLADRIIGFSDTMWEMGIRFADTEATAATKLQTFVESKASSENKTPSKVFEEMIGNVSISNMIRGLYDTKGGRRITDITGIKDRPVNIFTAEGSSILYLGEEVMSFINAGSMATFVSAGKTMSAFQSPTDLNDMMREMSTKTTVDENGVRTTSDMKRDMSRDISFDMAGHMPFQPLLYKLMGREGFTVEPQQMNLLRDEEDNGGSEYTDLTPRQELQLRIDFFLNNGNKTEAQYFISTQETRGRFQPTEMSRFTQTGAMKKYGITNNSLRGWINGAILQEMVRIGKAREEADTLPKEQQLLGYHDGGYKFISIEGVQDVTVGGENLSDIIYQGIREGHITPKYVGESYKAAMEEVSKMVDKFVTETMEQEKELVKKQIEEYNLWRPEQKGENGKIQRRLQHNFDYNAVEKLYKNNLDDLVSAYVENDFIFRYEMMRATRGNMAFLAPGKQLIDFYKRNGLLNSPGTGLFIREEEDGYGAEPFLNVANIADTWITEAVHDKEADGIAKSIEKNLIEEGFEEPAAKRLARDSADEYRLSAREKFGAKGSDAQAFLSEEGHRQFAMGEGLWNSELRQHPDGRLLTDDEWFAEYMDPEIQGPWLEDFTAPRKYMGLHTFAMGSTYAPTLMKNSFVTLNREFTKEHPLLDRMRNEMREKNIHIVNTISGEKGAKRGVINYEVGEGLIPFPVATNKFRQSQVIQDKKAGKVRMNIQIVKDQFTGVKMDDTNYKYNAGTPAESSNISGEKVYQDFHQSFVELQNRAFEQLKKDFGFDVLQQPMIEEQRQLAKLELLRKVRAIYTQQKIKNNMLDQNIADQMEIVKDVNGNYDFILPMTFGQNQREFENMFWSIFKKRVLRMMMPGKELVQVASPGKFNVYNYDTKKYEVRELVYMGVSKDGYTSHAEVMVRADVLKKLGLQPGDDLSQVPEESLRAIGYRIPHQGKSSTVIMKIVGILPENYNKSIVLPANVTVMTGSDFDVDKMFVMFPETDDAGNKIVNRQPNTPYSRQSDMALRNNMFNSIEAMATSPNHSAEQFRPLTTKRVEKVLEQEAGVKVEKVKNRFTNPLIEVEVSGKFKEGQSGVGVFANAMSGQAVATLNRSNISAIMGVEVHPQAQIKYVTEDPIDREKRLTHVTDKSIIDNSSTMQTMQEMVSAFVDNGNKPVAAAMNLNKNTYNAFMFMASVGMPIEDSVLFLQMPLVQEYIKLRVINESLTPGQAFAQMARNFRTDTSSQRQGKVRRRESGEGFRPITTTLESGQSLSTRQTLKKIKNEKQPSQVAKDMFYNFMLMEINGGQLSEFFKALTPDTMQNMGEVALFQAYQDNVERYERLGDNAVVASDVMQSFLGLEEGGVSQVPIQSNYYSLYQRGLGLASELFVTSTPAFNNFKKTLKDVLGLDSLTAKQHREINRKLNYHMATQIMRNPETGKDENPLAPYLTKARAEKIFLGKGATGNIATRLESAVKALPDLRDNKFISSLRRSPMMEIPGGATIESFSTEKMDAANKTALLADAKLLLTEPEVYLREDNTAADLKALEALVDDIVAHSLISSSMSPGYGKYYHSIPVEFFLNLKFGEFARRQEYDVRTNPTFFDNAPFLFEFIRNYGLKKYEGKTMVKTFNYPISPVLDKATNKVIPHTFKVLKTTNPEVFIAKRNKANEIDQLELYVRGGETEINGQPALYYYKVERKGYAAAFDELNLRNETGDDVAQRSILSGLSGRQAYSALTMDALKAIDGAVRMLEGTAPEVGKKFEHKCE